MVSAADLSAQSVCGRSDNTSSAVHLGSVPSCQLADSDAGGERLSDKSAHSSAHASGQPATDSGIVAVGSVLPGGSDKRKQKLSLSEQKLFDKIQLVQDTLQEFPDLLAARETHLSEQMHGKLSETLAECLPAVCMEEQWQKYPLPDRLAEAAERHERSGHAEMGTHRNSELSGADYRQYLWSLSHRELLIEHVMAAQSGLAKTRQIEHNIHFLEDRMRKFAALPGEIKRTYQQSTAAFQAAEDNADLAEQALVRCDWARERGDWLNCQVRGGCLSGLVALCWAACHSQPRSR